MCIVAVDAPCGSSEVCLSTSEGNLSNKRPNPAEEKKEKSKEPPIGDVMKENEPPIGDVGAQMGWGNLESKEEEASKRGLDA